MLNLHVELLAHSLNLWLLYEDRDLHREATGLKNVPITRHASSTFISPGFHNAVARFEDKKGTNNGRIEYSPRILHFITPDTQYTSLYWWMFARERTSTSIMRYIVCPAL